MPGDSRPPEPADEARRRDALRVLGASETSLDRLVAYLSSHFGDLPDTPVELPLDDEPHVSVWREYAARVATAHDIRELDRSLPQLRFPIAEGMRQDAAYRAATLRGNDAAGPDGGLGLAAPEGIRLTVHESIAGGIPVVTVPEREDFVRLLQAFVGRNEPIDVPATQGASIIGGYANWDRIRRHRQAWSAAGGLSSQWSAEFTRLTRTPELFKDRFLLLWEGPYSGVSAGAMGFGAEDWLAVSMRIRIEHECAHYLTRRVFDSMEDHLHDEFIADFAGICAAANEFRLDWFFRFLGIEEGGGASSGGRLANYLRSAAFTDDEVAVLRAVMHCAATNLARWIAEHGVDVADARVRSSVVVALAVTDLDAVAAPESDAVLTRALEGVRGRLRWRSDAANPRRTTIPTRTEAHP